MGVRTRGLNMKANFKRVVVRDERRRAEHTDRHVSGDEGADMFPCQDVHGVAILLRWAPARET
jgi:hypothetical protein